MSKKVFLTLGIVISLLFVFSSCVPLPTAGEEETKVNIVTNGDFSTSELGNDLPATTTNLGKWFTYEGFGASMDATINENNVFETTILSQGLSTWDSPGQPYWFMLQLGQWLADATNTKYILTFDASANTPTDIHVVVTLHAPNNPSDTNDDWWPAPNLDEFITLTPDSTSHTFEVDLSGWDPWNPELVYVKLGFEFGLTATDSTIYIDNVSLVEE